MILGRLLDRRCSTHGVVLVMTSNYPPRRPVAARAAARALPARDRAHRAMARRRRGRRAASTTGCARSSTSRRSTSLPARRPTRRWRASFEAMRGGPDEESQLVDRRPDDRGAGGAQAASSGSTSARFATDRARSATTWSSRAASPWCSCLGHPADGRGHRRPGPALHLADRHPVRSSREARRVRGRPGRRAVHGGARTRGSFRARSAA